MSLLSNLIVHFSLLVVLLAAMTPLGLAGDYRFVPAGLVLAVMYFWACRAPRSLPYWLVFLSGLVVDIVSYGPLGYWASVYVAGIYVARCLPGHGEGRGRGLAGWLGFVAAAAVAFAVAWVLACGYSFQTLPLAPFAKSTGVLIALHAPLTWILDAISRIAAGRPVANFERRG